MPYGHAPPDSPKLQGRRATRARLEREATPLIPRGVGAMLDTAWDIFSTRFFSCVGVAFGLTLLVRVTMVVVRYSGTERMTRQSIEVGMNSAVPLLVGVLMAKMVRDHIEGRESSAWESVRSTMNRLPSLVAITAILALFQFTNTFAVVCCFPIGLFVFWQLAVVPPIYAIEGIPISRMPSRTLWLMRGWGNFGRFLAAVAIQGIMFSGLSGVVVALDEPTARAFILDFTSLNSLSFDLISTIPSALFMAVASAFPAIALTVYYFDIRSRREGLDLEYRLDELVAEYEAGNLDGEQQA
ncbi:MAG: hypothetical protein ACI8TQ_001427 [Planctomycetota bacterium]